MVPEVGMCDFESCMLWFQWDGMQSLEAADCELNLLRSAYVNKIVQQGSLLLHHFDMV